MKAKITAVSVRSIAFWQVVAATTVVIAFFVGCAGTSRYYGTPADFASFHQTGMASYYGSELHGHKTASGERFDMYKLTAAHPSLPFGACVRVTNLANGKSVVVRINDRGPHTKRRIIDLSYAAAKQIGMVGTGTAKVKIDGVGE
jgi:rare lipoprotein A